MSGTAVELEGGPRDLREKYPRFPWTVMLKIDVARRGVRPTARFLEHVQSPEYDGTGASQLLFQWHQEEFKQDYRLPYCFFFRDGTFAPIRLSPPERRPYTLDAEGDRLFLADADGHLADIRVPPRAKYYGAETSARRPMNLVGYTKTFDSVLFVPNRYCHYFSKQEQCLYCDIVPNLQLQRKRDGQVATRAQAAEVYDVVRWILEHEPRRWRHICITGGSDPRGDVPYDDEADHYVEICSAVQRAFAEATDGAVTHWPGWLLCSPFERRHMERLRDTGVMNWGGNIEIMDRDVFARTCPGKARHLGFDRYRELIVAAVDVFGAGRVNTGFVAGGEVSPVGFADWEAGLESTLAGIEWFAARGVPSWSVQWSIEPGSRFHAMGAVQPPLEYYVRLYWGQYEIMRRYRLHMDLFCYRDQSQSSIDLYRLL